MEVWWQSGCRTVDAWWYMRGRRRRENWDIRSWRVLRLRDRLPVLFGGNKLIKEVFLIDDTLRCLMIIHKGMQKES